MKDSGDRRLSAARWRSAAGLTAPELEEILAGHHPFSAVLRLGGQLRWRILAADGMEKPFVRITNLFGLLPGPDDPSLPRVILARAKRQARRVLAGPSREEQRRNGAGWRGMELPQLNVYTHDDHPDAVCEVQDGPAAESEDRWLPSVLLPVYLRVIHTGGGVLHSAAVERNGEAVLLAGKGGAGKSTCCRRIVSPWRTVCDDLCLLVSRPGAGIFIHPLPTWSDVARNTWKGPWRIEQGVPLRGIFFLEQGEEDEFQALEKAEASIHLWKSGIAGTFHWRSGLDMNTRRRMERQLLETAIRAVKVLPAFRLRVSRGGPFWEQIERARRSSPAPD